MLNRREDPEMLTPEQIKAREFLVSLRGYDRDEVQVFLEEVAKLVGDLQAQVASLQVQQGSSPVSKATAKAEPAPAPPIASTATFFEDLGKTTQRILEAAHEAGSEIQRKARNEADRELAEAHARATKLVAEGQRRREVIEGVVHLLEERRAALADDLRGVLQAVDQVLADFAPSEQLLFPDEVAGIAEVAAPDVNWDPDDDLDFSGLDATPQTKPEDDDTDETDFRAVGQLKSPARDDAPSSDEETVILRGMRLG